MNPAPDDQEDARGCVMPIGGAERKLRDSIVLRRFVDLCGNGNARVVVIATASEAADTGRRYERIFRRMGVASAQALPLQTRVDCEREDMLDAIESASGVFLTGGNQLRLSTILGGTAVARTLRRVNARGTHVAGTSAGAAFVSQHMIAFGTEGSTPRAHMVALAPGLGLLKRVIIDQHFRQRDRLGRLLTALAYNPFSIGLGLDEDTATIFHPDDTLEVVGSGAVTLVDPAELEHSQVGSLREGEPVCLIGMRLHVLVQGATFHTRTRVAKPPAGS